MLQIDHVTKKYQNFTALKDIDLELDYGLYGLLAPNGAGKTTLMKMMATLLYPTEGSILWEGREIQKLDDQYREKLGFLPQDFGYYRDYTPERYLRYIGILKGIRKEQLKKEIPRLLEQVGLTEADEKKDEEIFRGDDSAGGDCPGPFRESGNPDLGRTNRRSGPEGAGAV